MGEHAWAAPGGLLERGLTELGYEPSTHQLAQLARFIREIDLWNPRLKLVGASGDELIVRHVLDSVSGPPAVRRYEVSGRVPRPAQPAWPQAARVADVGSGAGFPGIPLAIMEPDSRFVLVERSGRRAGFLRNAVAATRLPNAEVRECALEQYADTVDLAVFRAFLPLSPRLLVSLRRIVRDGGTIVAYKGRSSRIEAEIEGLRRSGAGGMLEPLIVPVDVPFLDEERHLLLVPA